MRSTNCSNLGGGSRQRNWLPLGRVQFSSAAAITIWVVLFPDNEALLSAFGLMMHNFFIFFNAAIGLLFLRRANRELGLA